MNKPSTYNVFIADDHQIFLDGLKMIFEAFPRFKIVAEAYNGSEVINFFEQHTVDFAIIDINMPKPNGFELCNYIKNKQNSCKVIILSMYNDPQFVKEFVKSGASAYVLKNAGKTELLKALESALIDEFYISNELKTINIQEPDNFVKAFKLTKREVQIIQMLSQGFSSQSIAEQLYLSVYTINTHRKNILHKLGLRNVAELISFASESQLL